MLTREENELLSRVGPGTGMGEFMRRFWVPALRARNLVADGPPMGVRLLGQNLVAFRATDGRIGILDEGCPHRGVSLTLARNADCALQCIFHGWKIDVSGKIVDIPTEPAERGDAFAARVKINHYPAREAAGIVWVWLGGGEPAAFPAFEFTSLPDSHVGSRLGIIHSSWLNGMEGQLDSAHVGILHQDWVDQFPGQRADLEKAAYDLSPRFEFEDQPYGYREAAVRNTPDGSHYVRVREFALPWYSFIPSTGGRDSVHLVAMSIPIDDEHSAQWDVFYNPVRPLAIPNNPESGQDPDDLARGMGGIETRFGQSRQRMKDGSFSGFSVLRHEDYAVAMGQGVFADRTKEFLGSSDVPIVRARRLMLDAVRRHAEGEARDFGAAADWRRIRAFADVIPKEMDWRAVPR